MNEPDDMTRCENALARLWEFLDGELPSAEEEEIQEHLEVCTRCYPQYDFQRAYFEFTARIKEREHAPPRLRRRLFQKILAQEARTG